MESYVCLFEVMLVQALCGYKYLHKCTYAIILFCEPQGSYMPIQDIFCPQHRIQSIGVIYLHFKYLDTTEAQLTFIHFKYKKQINKIPYKYLYTRDMTTQVSSLLWQTNKWEG